MLCFTSIVMRLLRVQDDNKVPAKVTLNYTSAMSAELGKVRKMALHEVTCI